MSKRNKLPFAIYIGLQRTGSTFLRHYFHDRSDLHCCRHALFFQTDQACLEHIGIEKVKQTYQALLAEEPDTERLIDMYESLAMGYLLCGLDRWVPEVFLSRGTGLSEVPVRADPHMVAERLYGVAPNARILMTIRNQGDWLDSNHRWFLSYLPPQEARFRDYLASVEGRLALQAGHYDRTVTLYQRIFGPDRVLVLPLEWLQEDEGSAIGRLCEFLEVPYRPYPSVQKQFNRGPQLDAPKGSPRRSLLGKLLGQTTRDVSPAPISESERSMIEKFYAASNQRLTDLLDRDLARWGYVT